MHTLCKDLRLSIVREADSVPGAQRIRITLSDTEGMLAVETCQPVTPVTEPTAKSGRYYVREAVLIALRRLVSDAFRYELISDSPGQWSISSPKTP